MKQLFSYIILSLCTVLAFTNCEDDERLETDLAINSQTVQVSEEEGTSRILIYSDGGWGVSFNNDDETPDWATLQSQSGNGNGEFLVAFTSNAENLPRAAKIVVKKGNKSDTIYFQQRGIVPLIDITDDEANVISKGGKSKTGIKTNIPFNLVTVDQQYFPESQQEQNWLTNITVNEGYLYFDLTKNENDFDREAKLKLSYKDALGKLTIDSLYVRQMPKSESDNAVLKDFAYLATLPAGAITEDIYIEAIVVSDKGNPNVATNPNIDKGTGNFHYIDKSVNSQTAYLQSKDRQSAVRILSKAAGDNSFERYERVEVWLKGLELSKDPLTSSITLTGLETAHIMDKVEGEAVAPKELYMKDLTDKHIYTFVKLKDVEFSIPFGCYTNIHEGYAARIDVYPNSIRDINGNNMYLLTNLDVPYRRVGKNLPQGSGTISGIIVHDKLDRFGGEVSRYFIRPLEESDIAVAEARSSGFSTVLLEWSSWKIGLPNPLTPDVGQGTLTHTAGTFGNHIDFSGLDKKDNNGMKNNGSFTSSKWWNAAKNEGESWVVKTSTTGISKPLSLQIEGNASVGGPRNWAVEWSTTGAEGSWIHIEDYTLQDQAEWSKTLLTQVPALKTLNFNLPQGVLGQANLYIRLKVKNNVAGTLTSDTGGTISNTAVSGRGNRLGHFSLKYNK